MIKITVPGKIHLLGEHFVVYGAPALLAAVNLRYTAILTPREDKTIVIISKNLNKTIKLTGGKLMEKRTKAAIYWKKYTKTNNAVFLKKIASNPLNHAVIAIAEAFKYYGKRPSKGFTIEIDSQVPINAGLGSSSATSVALAALITLYLKQRWNLKIIDDISYEAEKRRHGNPSGADNATITYGGIIRFIRQPKTIQPLKINIPAKLASNFVLIDTGKPKKSTGEMVSLAKTFKDKSPKLFDSYFNSQSKLADELVSVIKNGNSRQFMRIIKNGEKNLEGIGVVSKFTKKIIRNIEKAGGAAKMCGAGGTIGPTGIILAYHKDKAQIENIAKSFHLPYFDTQLGMEGLKYEP